MRRRSLVRPCSFLELPRLVQPPSRTHHFPKGHAQNDPRRHEGPQLQRRCESLPLRAEHLSRPADFHWRIVSPGPAMSPVSGPLITPSLRIRTSWIGAKPKLRVACRTWRRREGWFAQLSAVVPYALCRAVERNDGPRLPDPSAGSRPCTSLLSCVICVDAGLVILERGMWHGRCLARLPGISKPPYRPQPARDVHVCFCEVPLASGSHNTLKTWCHGPCSQPARRHGERLQRRQPWGS